ncbi:MAG: hypothetical protein LBE70_03705 [Nitrososphaerota archaeon]|jgi:uncharacterized protein YwgA|nr:hypothetical protein [Nitrososphaerota archaeon]
MARTVQGKLIDRLFTLYVIHRCRAEHGLNCISETKMQKIVFYAQKKLIDNRIKAINYSFVKVRFPTFSHELRNDLTDLTEQGFLSGGYYKEQEKAEKLLKDFSEVFGNNPVIKSLIDQEIDTYATMETGELVAKTQKLLWKGKRIESLTRGTPLLYPLKPEKVKAELAVSDEILEQLELCLSPVVAEKIGKANEDMLRGRRLTHAEVFGNLC